MDQLVLFIQNNWQNILTLVLTFATLLLTIFKKRIKVVESIKQFILERLPLFIDTAEKLFEDGEKKKAFVISQIVQLVEKTFGCDIDEYVDFISDSIESILATPQKKGE